MLRCVMRFEYTYITYLAIIGIIGIDNYTTVYSCVLFRGHLEAKAKMVSKKLCVLNRANVRFANDHLRFYKSQIRSHMEYCSNIWAGVPQYQLLWLHTAHSDSNRWWPGSFKSAWSYGAAKRCWLTLHLLSLLSRGMLRVLFDLIPPAEFHHRMLRQNL